MVYGAVYPPCTIFAGKNVVVTGDPVVMSRKQMEAWVVASGGTLRTAVSKKTDILVNGRQGDKAIGGVSEKQRKAYALKEAGHHIEIMEPADIVELAAVMAENDEE